MKKILIALVFVFAVAFESHAAVLNASDCSQTSVQRTILSAASGDTVQIPACPDGVGWSTGVSITKAITLQGAGCNVDTNGDPTDCATKILDSVDNGPLLKMACENAKFSRMTGIQFSRGTRAVKNSNAIIAFNCSNLNNTQLRVDHNLFDNLFGDMVSFNTVIGVADHNTWVVTTAFPIIIRGATWDDPTQSYGDKSWTSPVYPYDSTGRPEQTLFLEDNAIVAGPQGYFCSDAFSGGRAVFRFNHITRCHFEAHGTESTGRERGARMMEVYKNIVDMGGTINYLGNQRSGSLLAWGNSIANLSGNPRAVFTLDDFRTINVFQVGGGADGTAIADINDPANPYASLVAGAASYGCNLKVNPDGSIQPPVPSMAAIPPYGCVKVIGANWTIHQWKGFLIKRTVPCTDHNCFAKIADNTADTIVFVNPAASQFGTILNLAALDTFDINRVVHSLDQPGRGGGGLVSGNPAVFPPRFNDQGMYPMYEWDNTGVTNGFGAGRESCLGVCRENEHFYNYKGNFDGTIGTGSGPIANRPATCTPGVLYWANDEGEWTATHAGPDGRAYLCSAPNTWTLFYTPYTYPHPLTALSVVTTPVTFSVPTDGAVSYLTADTGSGNTTVSHGYIQTANNANMNLAGIATFGFRVGNALVSEAGVPAAVPAQSGRVFAETHGGVNTGIAMSNPNPQDAQVAFSLTDAGGATLSSGSFTLGSNQQISTFLNQPPFNGPPDMQGTFSFTSSVPVGAVALRGLTNERNEFLITTLPVVSTPPAAGQVVLAQFADGGGWSTQLVLTNPSDAAQSGTVQFFGQGSSSQGASALTMTINGTADSSFSYTLPPHSIYRLASAGDGSAVQVGSIRITPAASATAPDAVAIFAFRNAGITVSQASVAPQPLGSAFRIFMSQSTGPGKVSVQSGVAIANPTHSTLTVRLDLNNLDGSSSGFTQTVDVPADGQVSKFLGELFPGISPAFQGVAKLTAPSPVAAAALRGTYNERGDFLISTIPPLDATSGYSQLIFPHLVSGGGYSTQIVVFGQGGSATLYLFSQGGSPASVVSYSLQP